MCMPWLTSIRTKIVSGCVMLALVTLFVGVLSQRSQILLSGTTRQIYDNAFISMSYLRSAQAIILGISNESATHETENAAYIDQLQSALDALGVARERAMSERGEGAARRVVDYVATLRRTLDAGGPPPTRVQLKEVEQLFDLAVATYASDGLRFRNSAERLVDQTRTETYLGMFGSVAIAIVIAVILQRAVVPSIRTSVDLATSIAAGNLDNVIPRGGSTETATLFSALASMQESIADKISCIETLMSDQASHHAEQIALQHARFKAALNHMSIGLTMFDARDVLLVYNRRFVDMFAADRAEAEIHGLASELDARFARHAGPDAVAARGWNCPLDDGRIIAIREERMEDGARVVTFEDITERQRAEAHLAHMARHDALTGLPNRVLFREEVERCAQRLHDGGTLVVMCIDLDRFKDVNDTLGHPVGDALLCEAAQRLRRVIGDSATVVRLGGDEFAVIAYSSRRDYRPDSLAARVIADLTVPFEIDAHRISISASIGIRQTMASESPDVLLKNADLALYKAKADGGSTYRFFAREMDVAIQAKRSLEVDLRAALAAHQLELHYQPLVSADTGAVVAFEALLRWRHADRGLVSPADFIPLAEETGLIHAIGRFVIEQACHDAKSWPDSIKVAINLSPLQFRDAGLYNHIVSSLRRSRLPPGRLDVEITESLLLQDSAETLSKLHALRALGIRVSMDDFGTGYSSLSYLRRFPFDKIKIDRSFVHSMGEGNDGMAIVQSAIALGRSLRMTVVAEGVETEEQRKALCAAGCQELQGFLFSPPRPASMLDDIIGRFTVPQVA